MRIRDSHDRPYDRFVPIWIVEVRAAIADRSVPIRAVARLFSVMTPHPGRGAIYFLADPSVFFVCAALTPHLGHAAHLFYG